MPINVSWLDDGKTVCMLRRETGWTWEEFDAASDQANVLIKEVSHQVDMIVAGPDQLPPGSPLPHFRQAIRTKPANLRYLIVVISNPFGRAIFGVMSQLNRKRAGSIAASSASMLSVSTLDEAMKMTRRTEAVK
jgi:hypothetical protein